MTRRPFKVGRLNTVFPLPDGTPWGAVLVLTGLGILVTGLNAAIRAFWPQNSVHRKELLQERQRERARRRRERARRREDRARMRQEIDGRE
jgi:hypothetical protein